jgi:hypothetical protein
MTFLEIQDEVMNRLNLTSDSARTRIKGLINSRYRAVTSGVNMKRTRAATVNVAAVANTPTVTLSNVARLGTLYDPTLLKNVLTEVTLPFIRQMDAADAVVGVPTNCRWPRCARTVSASACRNCATSSTSRRG